MNHLAAYIKEREGFDSIVTEEGFASYLITGDECYIKDIFVYPDYRKKHIGAQIADDIARIAKAQGCKFLTGSVSTSAKDATTSTKVLIAYGFRVFAAVQGGIYFRKDL